MLYNRGQTGRRQRGVGGRQEWWGREVGEQIGVGRREEFQDPSERSQKRSQLDTRSDTGPPHTHCSEVQAPAPLSMEELGSSAASA